MEIKIKTFLGRERFQWSSGDANQLFIFIWPNIGKLLGNHPSFAKNLPKSLEGFQECSKNVSSILKFF